mmetsp:Transcript_14682/g.20441  ORF Transcript_14682/g.20441 Transcript_14682/m.20441 type:complete len:283 (-) Transcript_14682:279-1127(-)
MGGDDLGSDDEYLNVTFEEDQSLQKLEFLADTIKAETGDEGPLSSKRRKRKSNRSAPDVTIDEDSEVDEVPTKKTSSRVLLQAGRDLENQSADAQATFLWTALKHNLQLRGTSIENIPKIKPSHFYASKESTLSGRLRSALSMKKLKKWKPIGSPMVVVVCVSARRAVAVLKELSGLKVRAAKLFAKHMDVDQQKELLRQSAYGLAVGTPHRLRALCEKDEEEKKSALNFDQTQLVLLDSHTNPKGFTVCTLPDTAPDCMHFLSENVTPQLAKRKEMKIAIF